MTPQEHKEQRCNDIENILNIFTLDDTSKNAFIDYFNTMVNYTPDSDYDEIKNGIGKLLGREITYTESDFFFSIIMKMEATDLAFKEINPTIDDVIKSISSKLDIKLSDELINLANKLNKETCEE